MTWSPISDVTHLSHLLQPRRAQSTFRQEGKDLEASFMGTRVARLPRTVGAGRGNMEQWGVQDPLPWQHSSCVHLSLLLPSPLGRDSPMTLAATSPATV